MSRAPLTTVEGSAYPLGPSDTETDVIIAGEGKMVPRPGELADHLLKLATVSPQRRSQPVYS